MHDTLGTQLKDYVLTDFIGAGSYGSVCLARSNLTGENVVVKAISKTTNPERIHSSLEEVSNEIKAGKTIEHKSVVKFIDNFEDDQHWYLVLEHIQGTDLYSYIRHHLDKNIQIKKSFVKGLFSQLVQGLLHCHKSGIAHMDIKLENIMLDDKGNAKLIDFGLCEVLNGPNKQFCSRFAGSPDYASPEVLMRQPFAPEKADVWSLGVVLYILLTGEIPFARRERMTAAAWGKHPSIRWPKGKNLSSNSKDLLEKMLTIEADKRISMEQVAKHPWLRKKLWGIPL
eukprot:CAMPEP_0168551480 /NCGR_PEP_ID=MMETSP0413-20121227/6194_1 /TAXON_ID=136452 /ORGANISM="Filamoeba nolandi, Strain NC-AS-23-1" /LENGTH=283 /DNA_ID=CAMNT_0008582007 /DNA_START=49 /DNA_END=900 /DNA_ORIENTATION=+